ncbi:hypothetical protein SAMN04488239_1199 [Ruegeria marina]|uniref:Uncharacterized protein n=1 Tax=Ruegeria marina TaxID=639004 RepID=A0A1G7CSK2_9RHOB|nr:hypothetical protein SAMN04488239_1199 [Ruegeria marina]
MSPFTNNSPFFRTRFKDNRRRKSKSLDRIEELDANYGMIRKSVAQ